MDIGNGASAEQIRAWDNDHFVHPWDSMGTAPANRMIAAGGQGIHIYDPTGRRFIDGPGGMWCTQVGYGRAEIGQAMADQALRLPYHSPWAFAAEPSAMLAAKIASLTPGDLNQVFFTTGGSTAVDSALRFAQFRNNLLGRPEKKIILAREKGYHGSTYLSASVSGKERDRSYMDTEARLTHILPNVNPYLRPDGMSEADWGAAKVEDLAQAIAALGPERIAAFIAEPVLASGGVIVPPQGYHHATRALCAQHDILYISDEVVTGFGRLGHWFASEDEFGITPDIITCAKGLTSGYAPLGAMIVSDAVLAEMQSADREGVLFSNGYTYSGHPVSCAAALANIAIFERDELLQHVRRVAPRFQQRLRALARHEIVGDARGVGLLGCVEGAAGAGLPEARKLAIDHEFGARVDAKCEENGLIVRPLINMCVVSPPLIITEPEIDQMFDILDQAIIDVQAEMQ